MKITKEKFQELVAPIIGKEVTWPWKGYGSAIFIGIGELLPSVETSVKQYNREFSINPEFDWRIEYKEKILLGSHNQDPLIVEGLNELIGDKIETINVFGSIPELEITFSSGLKLCTMTVYSGDPEWRILLGNDYYIKSKNGFLFYNKYGKSKYLFFKEELETTKIIEAAAEDWGSPEFPQDCGNCEQCKFYFRINSISLFLSYGICASPKSDYYGRVTYCKNSCPFFEEKF